MPTRRSPSRPGSGPGRGGRGAATGTRRPRAGGRGPRTSGPASEPTGTSPAATRTEPTPTVASAAGSRPGQPATVAETRMLDALRRRSSLTTRAIALTVVLLVLVISYASSLRIYLSQRHEIAATQVEIAQREQQIGQLQSQLTRWNDPDYVKTQARARLGWVVPGETGYHVIGPDGVPVGANTAPSGADQPPPAPKPWWDDLWGSVKTADAPPAKPTAAPTITEKSTPKR
ncbi:cell division protein FtsB [Friedmanniella endophytica]|uniref:Cell division protein FtsB n=1 Tax=Microlunatus kandeliicorticis TaxID=1759536 RepID=A0A7W3ISS6_9ACTN|nr:septum formation initiator family protein [Microlunatus kandeliicorticis]MBA8794571.1 cell division protein FtsB [Microlunatus kandeliicorticis]